MVILHLSLWQSIQTTSFRISIKFSRDSDLENQSGEHHTRSLEYAARDARTNRLSLTDYVVFFALPIAGGVAAFSLGFEVDKDAYNVSVTFFGIFVALLLNIQVAIFSILQRGHDPPTDAKLRAIQDQELLARRQLLAELNANISYLVLFSCFALVAFLVFFVVKPSGSFAPALSVLLYAHFILTLVMIVKRSHALFQREYRESLG